ncbi:unnamed protein product [Malus baccata var. baccata]
MARRSIPEFLQQDANHRPSMSSVALMLKSETVKSIQTRATGLLCRKMYDSPTSNKCSWLVSANGLTIPEDVRR